MTQPDQQKLWSIPGNGVLARQGGLVLLTSIDDQEFAESLLDALARTSQAGGDGRALGDAISAQVEGHQSWGGLESGPAIVAFGPAGDGTAFTVLGAAAVEFSTSHAAEHRLTAEHPSMLLRSTIGVPVRSIRATLNRDETGSGTDRFTRLDSGTVRAGGLSYYAGQPGASAPRPAAPPAEEPSPVPPVQPTPPVQPVPPVPGRVPKPGPEPVSQSPAEPDPAPAEPWPLPVRNEPVPVPDEPAPPREPGPPREPAQPRQSAPLPGQPASRQADPDTLPPGARRIPPVPPEPAAPPERAAAEPSEQAAPVPPEPAPPAGPVSTPPSPTKPTPFDPAKYGASESPFETEPGVVVTGPSEESPIPFTAVDMTAVSPQETQSPLPEPSAAGDRGGQPIVLGVYCKNGHFTDPNSRSCLTCGAAIKKRAAAQQPGPRPPLGVLVFEDGEVLNVDGDYVIGRSPARDQAVADGTARPLRLVDDKGMVSRVHARIHLDGWQVLLADLGSANGTYVQPQGAPGAQRLEPQVPVTIQPGTLFYVGSACVRYEQAGS